jgi:hypothetical protein
MTTPPAASVPPLDDVILTGLRAAYPGWSIHRSRDGRWHATRRHVLPPSRQPPHYAPALTAQAPRFLAQAISRQPDHPLFIQHR